jgi:copper chaperone CopZ
MMSTLTFDVSGMHCGKCVGRMTEAFSQWAENVQVTLDPPRLTLINPRTVEVARLAAVASAVGGYALRMVDEAPQVSPLAQMESARPSANANVTASVVKGGAALARYKPLILIVGFILFASFITPLREQRFFLHAWMHDFMGVFFLVFAFFKLLDLRGFANAFSAYDPIASRWPAYGLFYPFIELALGAAFLLYWNMIAASAATIIVLGITTAGIVRVLRDKKTIQCACIGTGFNLPMSTVTVIENASMIGMSIWMIFLMAGH